MGELTTNQLALVGYMARDDRLTARGFELILKQDHPEDFFSELRRVGVFDPRFSPSPQPVKGNEGFFRIPSWPALNYLAKIAKISGERNDTALAGEVLDVTRRVARHNVGGGAIDNYHTHSGIAEILSRVPTSCVTPEDIDLVSNFLSTQWGNSIIMIELDRLMSNLLSSPSPEDRSKAVRLLSYCTTFEDVNNVDLRVRDRTTVADGYWLEQLLKHNAQALGQAACPAAWEVFRTRLAELFVDEYSKDHTWVHRPAIEEHEQNQDWDNGVGALIDAARDSLDAWLEHDAKVASEYVARLLADSAQVVRRIALNAVRTRWTSLREVFEASISTELFDVGHIHELYLLLSERFPDISDAAKDRLLAVILGLADALDDGSHEQERLLYQQRTWLDAIKQKGSQQADDAYNKLIAKLGPIGDHPSFITYHSSWWGDGPSPYSQEELAAFATDRSLLERIDSYTPQASELSSPRKALIDELIAAIELNPELYMWVLSSPKETTRPTQYGLIEGFSKAMDRRKGNELSSEFVRMVDLLLPFVHRVVTASSFWSEAVVQGDRLEPNKNWIPPAAVGLAKKLVRNDAIPLKEQHFDDLLGIVQIVKSKSDGIGFSEDPMTSSINNSRGMAIDALLHLILRRCRDADASRGAHEQVWDEYREAIDEEVSGCVNGSHLESSTLLASFLAQLIYVDSTWVDDNIERLFPQVHPENFACSVSGLSFANFSRRVYEALVKADVPRVALHMSGITSSARERMLERIALAYMWELEDLTSPVMQEIFADERIDDLIEIATTVARWHSANLKSEQVERAKQLAEAIVDFGMNDPSGRKNLFAVGAKFAFYVPAPNEEDMRWLLAVAPYGNKSFGGGQFLEALEQIANNDAPKALRLLQAFLSEDTYVHDHEGRMRSILRQLDRPELHLDVLRVVEGLVRATGDVEMTVLFRELRERSQTTL